MAPCGGSTSVGQKTVPSTTGHITFPGLDGEIRQITPVHNAMRSNDFQTRVDEIVTHKQEELLKMATTTTAPTYIADTAATYETRGDGTLRHEYGCITLQLHATHLSPGTWQQCHTAGTVAHKFAQVVVDKWGGQMIIAVPRAAEVWESCLGAPGDMMRVLRYAAGLGEDVDAVHLRYDFDPHATLTRYDEINPKDFGA